jgi:GNAT superfamily N-acetyltransferase
MPHGIVAVGAADLRPYAEQLRPFKRGIDGIVRLLERDPQQMLAVAALNGNRLRGMAMASKRAAGLWMVHDVFVFPGERRSGLGKALIAGIAARIGEVEGPATDPLLWAEILPYNRASQALFSQSGWREIAISRRRRSPQGPTL